MGLGILGIGIGCVTHAPVVRPERGGGLVPILRPRRKRKRVTAKAKDEMAALAILLMSRK